MYNVLAKKMDCRVKPGNDSGDCCSTALHLLDRDMLQEAAPGATSRGDALPVAVKLAQHGLDIVVDVMLMRGESNVATAVMTHASTLAHRSGNGTVVAKRRVPTGSHVIEDVPAEQPRRLGMTEDRPTNDGGERQRGSE